MPKTETKRLALRDLVPEQIIWSDRWNCCLRYVGKDFDGDHLFKFLHKEGFCVIIETAVYEPPSLLKELA